MKSFLAEVLWLFLTRLYLLRASVKLKKENVLMGCYREVTITQDVSTYKGQTVGSGYSIHGYQSATVPAGQLCIRKDAECLGGVVTGSFASSTCTVLSSVSMPAMQPIMETFETVMSETPNIILALNAQYGPHKADLNLTGIAPDYPGFKIIARVTFDSGSYRDWILQSINYENLPSGFSNPVVAMDAYNIFSAYKSHFVNVGSGGPNRYRMRWTISGQATPQVRPVYLPRMASAPWIGTKKGTIFKIRGNEPLNASAPPFNEVGALETLVSGMAEKLGAQSNHLVNMSFNVREIQYLISPEQANCRSSVNGNELMAQMFKQTGITAANTDLDWLFYTHYPSFGAQFVSPCLESFKSGFNGGMPATFDCPMCGPGGAIVLNNISKFSAQSEIDKKRYNPIMHELGHGLNLHDQYANILAPCTNSDPRNVKESELFKIDNSCDFLKSFLIEQSMGFTSFGWYDPIERSVLGWLGSGQVLTISQSGTYDLYTDNNDYTSDPTKPLILQLAIKRQGKIDFIYVITFNSSFIANYGTDYSQDIKDQLANSIRLSTSHGSDRSGLAWASSGSQNIYSFFNNDPNANFKHTIPPGVDVRINFGETDITIRLIEKKNTSARVQVTYNKPVL